LVVFLAGAALLFVLVDLGSRMAAHYRINVEARRWESEVAVTEARHQILEERIKYVQSDAYVEEIARTQLKWTRPGETVVVVMPSSQTIAPTVSSAEAGPVDHQPQPGSNWLDWWFAFFDMSPPRHIFPFSLFDNTAR
jgi:cell division protein FtsB